MKKSLLFILAATLTTFANSTNLTTATLPGTSGKINLSCVKSLSVNVTNFQGSLDNNNNKITINWSVAENQILNMFEIEKSTDGIKFQTAAIVFGTENKGPENYRFAQKMNSERVYYRIKMADYNGGVTYSNILAF